ncbi:MAG TPA: aryl-sulfate sulfotransferase [Polyangia bacterium]|nr:aryl-sulfate sulfotransferase [Polyangia bacterium]
MRGRFSPLAAALLEAFVLVSSACGGSSAGGSSGQGGSGSGGTGTGGASSAAGMPGTGGTGTGGAGTGGGAQTCTFTQSSSLSPMIATVGIVTWSTTLAGVQSARIDFGLTSSYGLSAPVDLAQASYRTLLLGMKSSHLYHYRITATNGGGDCQSPDYTIMTGPLANGLVKPTVTTNDAAALSGGFLITGQYVQNANGSAPGYILDSDGDIVWWYNIEDYVTGVVMDYAGTHMWINNHPPNLADAKVHRVSMDGMTDEDLSSQMAELSHQLTVMPDESVLFYAADNGTEGCSDIKQRTPDGAVRTIVNSQAALGTTGQCHVNNIQYSPTDDTLVFSDHIHCAVAKVKRTDGSVVWILNGETKTFTGDGWLGSEHGIQILGLDDFLIFNNNSRSIAGTTIPESMGTGDGSGALEIKLDLTAKTVTKIWSYKAMGTTYQTDVMGDLQRMANGNIVIAFGGKGVIQEIKPDGTVLQEMRTTTNFGYIQKRATLYGPPPR